MNLFCRLSLCASATLLTASAQAVVQYDISGTWSFTLNGHSFTNVQMDFVGIGTGAYHSATVITGNGPLTVEEYDLSSLTASGSGITINFGSAYSFETTLYQPGESAVAFGDAETNDAIFAMTINGIYDGTSAPFTATGLDPLASNEVNTSSNKPFQITDASNLSFSTSYVPEPAGWALMALGFGLSGTALRRKTRLEYRPA